MVFLRGNQNCLQKPMATYTRTCCQNATYVSVDMNSKTTEIHADRDIERESYINREPVSRSPFQTAANSSHLSSSVAGYPNTTQRRILRLAISRRLFEAFRGKRPQTSSSRVRPILRSTLKTIRFVVESFDNGFGVCWSAVRRTIANIA